MAVMECGICAREFNQNRKPTCKGCAQATLYGPRIEQASALLDREKHHTYAEAVVRPGNDGVIAALPSDADLDAITSRVNKHWADRWKEERKAVESRTEDIAEKAEALRGQIREYREYVAKQREQHARSQLDIAAERKQLDKQKAVVLEPVQAVAWKASQRLEKVHNRTVDARALLCREAALLSGLDRRRAGKDGKSRYWLGGAPIPDLLELSSKTISDLLHTAIDGQPTVYPHDTVSAGLTNVCRLLGSCCHYLSVRLPAEIILPHNDFPHTTILPMTSSYKLKDPRSPRMSSSQSSSPAASRLQLDRRGVPLARPRPLHLDLPLSQLVKEDPKTFQMFVEGVTLLAFNIAWLCKSQGVESINSFEDVCAIGRNLYQLLLAQERPPLDRNVSSATTRTDRSKTPTAPPGPRLGAYSHGSAFLPLSGAEGVKLFQGWRLPLPTRLADKLKSYLVNEISGAEWDFLSDKEWDEEREEEAPVLVGGARQSLDKNGPAMSVMTVAPHDGATDEPALDEKRAAKGSSGWMKVRGRGGDV